MARTGKTASTRSADLPQEVVVRVRRQLLRWFAREQRDLPWRKTTDPYAIWVSEAMLQQTQVATVIPYWQRWMARFPTPLALAQAPEDEVLHAWQGLGYYSRARNLRAAAQTLVAKHDGELPTQSAALRQLPGIGKYTASAIASIAFGERTAVVDGNVSRVLSRLLAIPGAPAERAFEAQVSAAAERLVPSARPGDFNQAMMELGATVCRPKAPECGTCPVRDDCRARALGRVTEFPAPKRRPSPETLHMAAAVVLLGGSRRTPVPSGEQRVLLVQVPDDAPRWASMWQFPNVVVLPGESPAVAAERAASTQAGARVSATTRVLIVRHAVTRYRITLAAHWCHGRRTRLRPNARFVAVRDLERYALPAAHARIAKALSEGEAIHVARR